MTDPTPYMSFEFPDEIKGRIAACAWAESLTLLATLNAFIPEVMNNPLHRAQIEAMPNAKGLLMDFGRWARVVMEAEL